MTTDVLELLGEELVQAARREIAAKAAATRRRRRQLLVGGATGVVMLVATPLALSLSGVVSFGSKTLDAGRTFTVERLTGSAIPTDARRHGCEAVTRVTIGDADGKVIGYSDGCGPVELPEGEVFQGGVTGTALVRQRAGEDAQGSFLWQSKHLLLLAGTIADSVKSAELTGSTDLELRDADGVRMVVATTADPAPKLTLRGDGEKVLEVRDFGPLLPWNRGADSAPRSGTVAEPERAGSRVVIVTP